MPLRPTNPTTSHRPWQAVAVVLWLVVALSGSDVRAMRESSAGLCVAGAPTATLRAVSESGVRAGRQGIAEDCCDVGDCEPGQCPTPCHGVCTCLLLHASALPTATPPVIAVHVSAGPRPVSRVDRAPRAVSREPALRPPIA